MVNLQDKRDFAAYNNLPFTQQQQDSLAMWEHHVNVLTDQLLRVDNASPSLGTVLMSSGLHDKVNGAFVPDWALIALDEERFTQREALKNVSLFEHVLFRQTSVPLFFFQWLLSTSRFRFPFHHKYQFMKMYLNVPTTLANL